MENLKAETRAGVLVEALPYLQEYNGKIVVVKYGGNAMINEDLKQAVIRDIVLLNLVGVKVVLVHGGDRGTFKEDRKRVQIHQGSALYRQRDDGSGPDGPLRKAQ